MKLWEIVFEFHHNATAIIGMEGAAKSSAPCANESAISNASHFECRRIPSLIHSPRLQRFPELHHNVRVTALIAAATVHLDFSASRSCVTIMDCRWTPSIFTIPIWTG